MYWSKKQHHVSCVLQCQFIVQHLCIAYNNSYPVLHYIPWNESDDTHQVIYFVRTFDALVGNNWYAFVEQWQCASSLTFLSSYFNCLMLFIKLHFCPILLLCNISVWQWPNAVFVRALVQCSFSPVLTTCVLTVNLPIGTWLRVSIYVPLCSFN